MIVNARGRYHRPRYCDLIKTFLNIEPRSNSVEFVDFIRLNNLCIIKGCFYPTSRYIRNCTRRFI